MIVNRKKTLGKKRFIKNEIPVKDVYNYFVISVSIYIHDSIWVSDPLTERMYIVGVSYTPSLKTDSFYYTEIQDLGTPVNFIIIDTYNLITYISQMTYSQTEKYKTLT